MYLTDPAPVAARAEQVEDLDGLVVGRAEPANAPITNTAVAGLPGAQAGVAGGIVSDTAPAGIAHVIRPWLVRRRRVRPVAPAGGPRVVRSSGLAPGRVCRWMRITCVGTFCRTARSGTCSWWRGGSRSP